MAVASERTRPTPRSDWTVDVVYHDESLVVVNKPHEVLCVPGRAPQHHDCLSKRVQTAFDDALIVHRLDMATSGLVVMARGPEVQRRLSRAFAQREVRKRYEAVVQGLVPEPGGGWGEIDLPLICDWPRRPKQKVCFEHGKPSCTRYRVMSRNEAQRTTRLELEPVTGRSHQLRVHLLALGYPIVGDALYLDPPPDPASRMCLHATRLALAHPRTGVELEWVSRPSF